MKRIARAVNRLISWERASAGESPSSLIRDNARRHKRHDAGNKPLPGWRVIACPPSTGAASQKAALDGAPKSTFECRGCSDAVTAFPLRSTFGLRDDPHGFDCNLPRLRAAKRLYLGRDGLRRGKVPPNPAVGHTLTKSFFGRSGCLETEAAR